MGHRRPAHRRIVAARLRTLAAARPAANARTTVTETISVFIGSLLGSNRQRRHLACARQPMTLVTRMLRCRFLGPACERVPMAIPPLTILCIFSRGIRRHADWPVKRALPAKVPGAAAAGDAHGTLSRPPRFPMPVAAVRVTRMRAAMAPDTRRNIRRLFRSKTCPMEFTDGPAKPERRPMVRWERGGGLHRGRHRRRKRVGPGR